MILTMRKRSLTWNYVPDHGLRVQQQKDLLGFCSIY
jgi:hypothetical protein